jgi:hypothetical protein
MTIGISEEHVALHETARRWVETHAGISVARAAIAPPADSPATNDRPSAMPNSEMSSRVIPAMMAGSPLSRI